jgi:DNA-binding NarL/FixJ family response regulator
MSVGDTPIRIAIVENHRLVADALEALLNRQADMVVVGNLGSVAETARRAKDLNADVAILDFRLDDGTAVDAARAMSQAGCEAKVVFLTRHESDSVVLAAIEAGASAVLYKSGPTAELMDSVRTVAHGASLISPGTVATLLRQRRVINETRQRLTHRETEVLIMMAAGVGSREIAARMGISYVTVRTHLRNVAGKLSAHSKLEVLAKARQLDLVA